MYRVFHIKIIILIWLKMAVKSFVNQKTRAYSHHKDPPFDMKYQLMSADSLLVIKIDLD